MGRSTTQLRYHVSVLYSNVLFLRFSEGCQTIHFTCNHQSDSHIFKNFSTFHFFILFQFFHFFFFFFPPASSLPKISQNLVVHLRHTSHSHKVTAVLRLIETDNNFGTTATRWHIFDNVCYSSMAYISATQS